MGEEKIVIEIAPDGSIKAKTDGFKGDICLSELQKLIGKGELSSLKPSDDFFQEVKADAKNKIKTRG